MAWLVRSDHVISSLHRSSRRLTLVIKDRGELGGDESTLLRRGSILLALRLDFGVFIVRLGKDGSITSLRYHRPGILPILVIAMKETFIVPQKIAEHSRLALGDIFEVIE
ncbi:MAG: hypothetical protein M0019_05850 [Actinomycetota bacterium]|nr:hypothetical protein [Actinomycetota bacterium]